MILTFKRLKRAILLVAAFLFLTCACAWGASSMTEKLDCTGNYCILTLKCTTHSDGTFDAEETTTSVDGWMFGILTDPDGTAAPTDNYDINIQRKYLRIVEGSPVVTYYNIDGDSGTWSAGECTTGQDGVVANRDTSVTEFTQFLNNGNYGGQYNRGKLRVDVSNAGNSKVTVIEIPFLRIK